MSLEWWVIGYLTLTSLVLSWFVYDPTEPERLWGRLLWTAARVVLWPALLLAWFWYFGFWRSTSGD